MCSTCSVILCSDKCFQMHRCSDSFWKDLQQESIQNEEFKKFIYQDEYCELALQSIDVRGEVKKEKHKNATQIIRVESGRANINGNVLEENSVIVIPPGTEHIVKNAGKDILKFSTVYAPASNTLIIN